MPVCTAGRSGVFAENIHDSQTRQSWSDLVTRPAADAPARSEISSVRDRARKVGAGIVTICEAIAGFFGIVATISTGSSSTHYSYVRRRLRRRLHGCCMVRQSGSACRTHRDPPSTFGPPLSGGSHPHPEIAELGCRHNSCRYVGNPEWREPRRPRLYMPLPASVSREVGLLNSPAVLALFPSFSERYMVVFVTC